MDYVVAKASHCLKSSYNFRILKQIHHFVNVLKMREVLIKLFSRMVQCLCNALYIGNQRFPEDSFVNHQNCFRIQDAFESVFL